MTEKVADVNPLLRRPLYVFDLPPELLSTLRITQTDKTNEVTSAETVEEPKAVTEDPFLQSTSCRLCKATFPTLQDQRQHVKSDLHRYNLKLSIKQQQTIDEQKFTRLIGDLDESISGSDSSESEEEDADGKDTTLTALLKRQVKLSQQDEEESQTTIKKPTGGGNAPVVWFSSPKIGDDNVLGIYRALFSKTELESPQSLVTVLENKQLSPVHSKHSGNAKNGTLPPSTDPHYFLCMIGGGHFAAMTVSLMPEVRKGPGGVEERHAIVRAHKTFHRYTTRRKQGGSQSANDNAKGNAHSAGSSIRRYNEAALEVDIRSILSEWKSMIESAELLFIRATGATNRRTLFGPYDGQVMKSNDPRIRGFPFSTRRATQAELLRSFQALTRMIVSKVVETAPEPIKPESATTKPISKPAPIKLSKEEEALILHTSQLQALIRRSKAPGVLLYLTKNQLSPNFAFHPPSEYHHAPTPLHLSASTVSPALVAALLVKANADPTVKNNDGKTAFDIAGDMNTRDAFRVARHTLGESVWDWNAAMVPSGLSQDEVDARQAREKKEQDAAEHARRKADLDEIAKQEERRNAGRMERKAGIGKGLNSTAAVVEKTGQEKREEEARGLTPEMRMRLERERRARAAEERMKRMQGGGT